MTLAALDVVAGGLTVWVCSAPPPVEPVADPLFEGSFEVPPAQDVDEFGVGEAADG